MSVKSYDQFFPFQEVRLEQRTAIEFALNAVENENKKFVLLEMGTGTGKSATAVTIARSLLSKLEGNESGAYFLTTQKVLQDQYMSDFGPSALGLMRTIKSSSNYRCVYHPNQTCAESRRVLPHLRKLEEAKDFVKTCNDKCPYSKEKSFFITSSLAVTNFSYFLAETKYAGKLEPRHLLIIDEAHNIEAELSKFIEVTFSEKFSNDVLKCKFPSSFEQVDVINWVKKSYLPALNRHIKKTESQVKKEMNSGDSILESSKRYEMLDKHVCKVNRFVEMYDPQSWILNCVEIQSRGKKLNKFEFKPITVSGYSTELFKFGEKVIMLSATILNKVAFCRSIGLDEKDVAFISIPSPFLAENKPVHILPVGSMSINNINQTLPKMVQVIDEILKQHPNEKGMIHAVNYKIANYIKENIKNSRILTHDSSNRDLVLKQHMSSSEPTVLLSPSMMEGVDLADDASRFQILCKVPFPYLGDLMVQKRMKNDDLWYPYQTAKSIIQSLGRSIRNEKDYAVSYLLDADWENFYAKHSSMFSIDFCKVLK